MYVRQRRGLSDLQSVASAIQTQEGWYPGSRSYRNNNPGNIICSPFTAKTRTGCDADGFAIFPDFQTGQQAEMDLINSYANRGFSIQDFVAKWTNGAPASYTAAVASAGNVSPSDPLAAALDESGGSAASLFPSDVPGWVWGGLALLGLLAASSLVSD